MEITKEQYQQWKSNAVTEYVLELLEEYRSDYMNALRGYARNGDSISAARCEGMLEGLEQLLSIEYEDPSEDNKDA